MDKAYAVRLRLAAAPALRWKLANLETFRKRRPVDFESQANALETLLDARR